MDLDAFEEDDDDLRLVAELLPLVVVVVDVVVPIMDLMTGSGNGSSQNSSHA